MFWQWRHIKVRNTARSLNFAVSLDIRQPKHMKCCRNHQQELTIESTSIWVASTLPRQRMMQGKDVGARLTRRYVCWNRENDSRVNDTGHLCDHRIYLRDCTVDKNRKFKPFKGQHQADSRDFDITAQNLTSPKFLWISRFSPWWSQLWKVSGQIPLMNSPAQHNVASQLNQDWYADMSEQWIRREVCYMIGTVLIYWKVAKVKRQRRHFCWMTGPAHTWHVEFYSLLFYCLLYEWSAIFRNQVLKIEIHAYTLS